jgi:2-phosphoglycerate kinase
VTDDGLHQNATSPWSVLLIAGAWGCGKSTVSQEIAKTSGATWVQVDVLRLALQWSKVRLPSDGATDALYFFERTPDIWGLPAERLQEGLVAVGEVMADAIAIVTGNHVVQRNPAVIEGDGILPSLLDRPDLAEFVATGKLKMVVLDPPTEEWLLANMIERGRGIPDRSEDETRNMARTSWLYAQWLKREAEMRQVSVVPCLPWETLPRHIDEVLKPGLPSPGD